MNIVNFKQGQDEHSGLTIVNVPHYQTSDGKYFQNKIKAEKHQKLLNKADELTRQHLGTVYGTTMRGWGTEFVNANYRTLYQYTVSVLEELTKDNKFL